MNKIKPGPIRAAPSKRLVIRLLFNNYYVDRYTMFYSHVQHKMKIILWPSKRTFFKVAAVYRNKSIAPIEFICLCADSVL